MKKIVSGFVAIFALLLLANCTIQTKASQNVKKDWMLVEFQNFNKEVMMSNKAHLNLANEKEPGKFSANMGCNNMFGTATFNANGTVKFSAIGSTMMFCDKVMDLESAFSKELPTMTNYKVDGHYLTLSNAKGEKMKFVAADWD
ncbi:META domain-containing protein [Kaistella sp.]|uniref:META domain-containing protein n=1 Tax=Kaistella sp. TaxID=2782235 RepID=UPI003C4AF870